jgi:hypothetical protein
MTLTEDNTTAGDHQDVDRLAEQLLDRADADQAQLLGPDGLLTQRVLNRTLDAELTEHLATRKATRPGVARATTATAAPPSGC